ncbi:MAG: DUF4062 domain-containing protein [Smithella sp.]|jgi:hypothetical protein
MSGYTVFLSSTFSDLNKERTQVCDALALIPVSVLCAEHSGDTGKRLSPTLKGWIDEADAVILLIGQHSGTLSGSGKPWTQVEARYAIQKKKRLFVYVRQIPDELRTLIDQDLEAKRKLEEFICFIEKKIANVPRFNLGQCCRLTAMVVRDVDRYLRTLEKTRQEASYLDSFT